MLAKQAKILSALAVADLLAFADRSSQPLRDRVMVLLSTKASLRAGEIAGLTWDMVLDASGQLSNAIGLRDAVAQKGSGRLIPLSVNSPTGSTVTAFSTFVSTRAPGTKTKTDEPN